VTTGAALVQMGDDDNDNTEPICHLGQGFEDFPRLDVSVAVSAAHIDPFSDR